MKSEELVRQQLEEVYQHRLLLRIERKMKRCYRNCLYGMNKEFDLGDFGTINRWQCQKCKKCDSCAQFECVNTHESIQKEMINDISNPATCGAKEPKIAMLMWVLHDNERKQRNVNNESSSSSSKGFFDKLKEIFK